MACLSVMGPLQVTGCFGLYITPGAGCLDVYIVNRGEEVLRCSVCYLPNPEEPTKLQVSFLTARLHDHEE